MRPPGRSRLGPGPLLAKAFRDLGRSPWQVFGLALLVAIVVANVGGRARARALIEETRRAVYARLHLADLEVRCRPTDPDVLLGAARAAGVQEAEARLLLWGAVRPAGQRPMSAVVRLLPADGAPVLSSMEIVEGRWPRPGEAAVVIDRSLRDLNDVQVGQEIGITVGALSRRLPVVGVSLSAELLITPTHPRYVLPLRGTLAVLGVSAAAASDIEGAGEATSLLLKLHPDAEVDTAVAAIAAVDGVDVLQVIPVERQPGRLLSDIMLANFDVYTPPILLVLSLAGVLLLVLTVGRAVGRQREQIGVLLAQGYRRVPLAASFGASPVVSAVIGCALGWLAHAWVAEVLASGLVRFTGYAPLVRGGTPLDLVVACGACLVVSGLAGFLIALGVTGWLPAHALRARMHDPARGRGKRSVRFFAEAGRLLGLPLSVRLGLAQVVRRPAETWGAAIGLGSAFAVVLAFLMVHLAHRREVQSILDQWTRDAIVHFRAPVPPSVVEETAGAAGGSAEGFVSRPVLLRRGGGVRQRRLVGLLPEGAGAALRLARGRALSSNERAGALIDRWVAREDGLEVGDRAVLLPSVDSDHEVEVEVVGVLDGVSLGRMVVPLEVAQDVFELEGACTSAHVTSPLEDEELEDTLWYVPGVETVFGTRRIAREIQDAWRARAWVIRLAVAGSALLALVFLALIAVLDAADRGPQLAVLRSLGWRERAIYALLASEVLVRGLLAVLLACLLGPLLAHWLAERMAETNGFRIVPAMPAWLFLAVLGPGLAVVPLGALPAWRVARKMAPTYLLRLLCRE